MAQRRSGRGGSRKKGPARRRTPDEGSAPRRSASADDPGEFLASDVVKTALIPGNTFRGKPVQYVVVDGLAIFEGDIVLGTDDQVARTTEVLRAELSGQFTEAVVITGDQFRWPNCTIPFAIDPALTNQQRVTDAIAHWEQHTQYHFVAHTTEADFVTFRPASGCSSSVGRQGGEQFVNLGTGCSTGSVIHEIGHVVGLWHEQSREDRDAFVTVNWDKIQAGKEHNFNQHITDGDDVGAYDYGSIMHYPRDAFSVDGSDTITPVDPAASIGQRTALSSGDIAAANSLCPPKIIKEGVKDIIKDGRKDVRKDGIKDSVKDGRKDPIFDTRKELTKDIRLDTRKESVADTAKEMIKDRIKEVAYDPPFGKIAASDVVNPGGLVTQPGVLTGRPGVRPFAVVTPHAAPGAGDPGGLEATIANLDAQLEAIAGQLGQAESARDALQAQYDQVMGALQQALDAHDQSMG